MADGPDEKPQKIKLPGAAQDLRVLIAAKYTLVGIESIEERRVTRAVLQVGASFETPYAVKFWSCVRGVTVLGDKDEETENGDLVKLDGLLNWMLEYDGRAIFLLRDAHPYLNPRDRDCADTIRKLREVAMAFKRTKQENAKSVILLSPALPMIPELDGELRKLSWPLPDAAEMRQNVELVVVNTRDAEVKKNLQTMDKDLVVQAITGMTTDAAGGAMARSIAIKRTIDPDILLEEKKEILKKSSVLEILPPYVGGLDQLGGLDNVKEDLRLVREAFSEEARTWKIPYPKGAFFFGVPGGGKTALARAAAWDMKVLALRFNVSAIFSSSGGLSGMAENALKEAFKILNAIGAAVVLFDEIDKALAGGVGVNDTDNRVKGELFTWFQDRPKVPIYPIATANNIEAIVETAPELIRDGRWDERYFFDLPTLRARREIVRIKAKELGITLTGGDVEKAAQAAHKYTGAEIESALAAALRAGFKRRVHPGIDEVLAHIGRKKPLAVTAGARIEGMRKWAKGRAIWAEDHDDQQPDTLEVDLT